jgi:hypothetical protein
MPARKLTKIVGHLLALRDSTTVSLSRMRDTVSLLRYLGICILVAKSFYNWLQAFVSVSERAAKPLKLHDTPAEDIHESNRIPVKCATRHAHDLPAGALLPYDHINMKASDLGVCGVWHIQRLCFALQKSQ